MMYKIRRSWTGVLGFGLLLFLAIAAFPHKAAAGLLDPVTDLTGIIDKSSSIELLPKVELDTPALSVDTPLVKLEIPAVEVKVSNEPEQQSSVSLPSVRIETPVVEISTPVIQAEVPSIPIPILEPALPTTPVPADTPPTDVQTPAIPEITVTAPLPTEPTPKEEAIDGGKDEEHKPDEPNARVSAAQDAEPTAVAAKPDNYLIPHEVPAYVEVDPEPVVQKPQHRIKLHKRSQASIRQHKYEQQPSPKKSLPMRRDPAVHSFPGAWTFMTATVSANGSTSSAAANGGNSGNPGLTIAVFLLQPPDQVCLRYERSQRYGYNQWSKPPPVEPPRYTYSP